jgi:hypothetical protein
MNIELLIAYIAKGLTLLISIILYVYLFSAVIPNFIMRLRVKRENTRDRGIKKFVYPNGRCVLYETELSIRKFISNYALYTEDGYKYIKCKAVHGVSALRYDIYAFDVRNKLIDIIGISEVLGADDYTESVPLPPETSYVRFVLRKADDKYYSNQILLDYSSMRYVICAIVVALATALEATLMYVIVKDILINALRLKIQLSSTVNMIVAILVISLLVAGFTVLAYRRNCKKVVNR